MGEDRPLEEIVREYIKHSIDEIPAILRDYIEKCTASLNSYLITAKNKDGKCHYHWVYSRFTNQSEYDDIFKWLHSLFPDIPENRKTHDLIEQAKNDDDEKKRLNYSCVDDVKMIVGTILKHRGNYTLAAKELGYADHSGLSQRMEELYARHPMLAEVVYLVAVGHAKLYGRLQKIHYRKLDEGMSKVARGELTKTELAKLLGYRSLSGLSMLIKRRAEKTDALQKYRHT